MHKTFIVGRMGSDPKPLGQAGCYFSVATERYGGQGKPRITIWSRIKVFGKQAEFVNKYLGKGRMVAIDAHYENSEYDDAQTGAKRQDHYFVADNIEPAGSDGSRQGAPRTQPEDDENPLW